ncbi:hypothetical protein NL108_016540 [Boleophthalmus pectinirostris]|nr:hypothetical protein NL108_016540 [Boleophthalmus pectinirostris]
MEVPRVNGHSEQTLITSSDALLEIVRSHFQMIGSDGWEKLSRGSWDMQTKQMILSMFAQMVQNISTNVLRVVIPLSEVRVCTNVTESMRVLPTITAVLQESIGLVLARALNMSAVPSEVNKSIESQELTAMIENEVTHKVNSVLSNTSKLQEQRCVIVVDSSLSSPSVASSIVDKALVCLKHCLNAQIYPCASRNPAATPVPASAHAPTAARRHPQVVVPSFVSADLPAIVLKTPPQYQQKTGFSWDFLPRVLFVTWSVPDYGFVGKTV